MSVLEWDGIYAGYGKAVVIRDLTLAVDEGEVLAVVGRNGAGKSTLLGSVFGVPAVFGGVVRVTGEAVPPQRGYRAAQRGAAIAPQGKHIIGSLTVEENLLLGAAGRRLGGWDRNAVYHLFPMLGERSRSSGAALSGGQQQMLSIGRALMANPRVLLLDEPSEGLAPVVVDQIVHALAEIRAAGTSLVIVEQHLPLVRRVADRFAVLVKGAVAAEGPIADIDAPELQGALAL